MRCKGSPKFVGLACALVLLQLFSARVAAAQNDPVLVLEIGTLDVPESEVFGRIIDVEVDSAGNIFVLDAQSNNVRWFDRAGRFRGAAGHRGSGPGELMAPQAMTLDAKGDILILDPRNARMSRYRVGPDGLHHEEDLRTSLGIDLCAIGERLFILTGRPDSLISEVDMRGRLVNAWGSLVEPDEDSASRLPPAISRSMANRGRLLCDRDAGMIVMLHEQSPVVRAFDLEGKQVWRIELADYHQIRVVRSGRTGGWTSAPDPKTGTVTSGAAIASMSRDTIAISLFEGGVAQTPGSYELRLLDLRNGSELGRYRAPIVVNRITATDLVGHVMFPFPQIHRYELHSVVGRK